MALCVAYTKTLPNVHRQILLYCTRRWRIDDELCVLYVIIAVCVCVCVVLMLACEHALLRISIWCVRDEWTSIPNKTFFFSRRFKCSVSTSDQIIPFGFFTDHQYFYRFEHSHFHRLLLYISNFILIFFGEAGGLACFLFCFSSLFVSSFVSVFSLYDLCHATVVFQHEENDFFGININVKQMNLNRNKNAWITCKWEFVISNTHWNGFYFEKAKHLLLFFEYSTVISIISSFFVFSFERLLAFNDWTLLNGWRNSLKVKRHRHHSWN